MSLNNSSVHVAQPVMLLCPGMLIRNYSICWLNDIVIHSTVLVKKNNDTVIKSSKF